ncbi:MAG: phosphoribosyl-AMP cyclohydrolase [Saprospiraceae bacterium]|nr:phosphoribosyl-AMP cyclohydrolase [Saprospiraceae bacterium]
MKNINFLDLTIKYNEKGLVPVVVQDKTSNEVLMMAWMSSGSLEQTIRTRSMVYWSRSRNELWIKGQTSGNTQHLVELLIDCDQDCLLAIVNQVGSACHTNNKSCFFRSIK